ncbi:MAG: BON domain-containing protein [Rickettsiales bacterium]|nr:BON domain-containing protein [Rickettsiales bacterium]
MKKISAVFLLLLLTTSCVETVVVGSFATISVVTREKTLNSTVDDTLIVAQIDKDFLMNGLKGVSNSVGVTVNEGRVLLTGVIRDTNKGDSVLAMVWKVKGVKEVMDEIEVNKNGVGILDFSGPFSDSYITALIKAKLFFYPQIFPSNYKVTTFNHVVYLIGVYKSEDDLKELLRIVSKTSGVKKVVNYVILANDSRRK